MIVGMEDVDLLGLEADVQAVIDRQRDPSERRSGPCVTLTYAQSLDGSIAACTGGPLRISCERALDFTHRLRAMHEVILVGINTVLTDDPRLTVRRSAGPNPHPVVVDSHLRIPLGCRLVQRPDAAPALIVATTESASERKAELLVESGAEVWRLPATATGGVDLSALFARLGERGFASVMVEGGARVITSVVTSRLADQLIVTLSPRLVGGIRAFGTLEPEATWPELVRVRYLSAGTDLLIHAEFA